MEQEWQSGAFNEVLDRGDWYLSFNPDTSAHPLGSALDRLLVGEEQGAETAICVPGEPFQCYILKGDHRNALEHMTFREAMSYFREHREQWGPTTDKPEELPN